jgi:hypothetical protein
MNDDRKRILCIMDGEETILHGYRAGSMENPRDPDNRIYLFRVEENDDPNEPIRIAADDILEIAPAPKPLSAEYHRLNAEYRGEDLGSLMDPWGL